MLILALESTSAIASAALWRDGSLLAQATLHAGHTHSTTLLPLATEILRIAGCEVADVDLFAAAVGPGSFTGVRIAAATAEGLAFGLDKPLVGVSSLEALAYNLKGITGILCPVIGARRSQFYTALFSADSRGIHRLTEDEIVLSSQLSDYLASYDAPVYLTGDGYAEAYGAIRHPKLTATPDALCLPAAFGVAEAAFFAYQNAADPESFKTGSLAPIYLRKTQAEREREERLAIHEKS